jgi:hypothetical protein
MDYTFKRVSKCKMKAGENQIILHVRYMIDLILV